MKRVIMTLLLLSLYAIPAFAQDGYIGEIRMFAGAFAPSGWAFCDGSLLPVSSNTALFSIIGTIYGGDGRTNFALPDLRGRVAIQAGSGPGLSTYREGQKGGAESVTLTANQIPAHDHQVTAESSTEVKVQVNSTESESQTPGGNYLAKSQVTSYIDNGDGTYLANPEATTTTTITQQKVGGSQAHENRPPYLAINYIICLKGVFPSRN